jgi:hypothetical protein
MLISKLSVTDTAESDFINLGPKLSNVHDRLRLIVMGLWVVLKRNIRKQHFLRFSRKMLTKIFGLKKHVSCVS